MLPYSRTIVLFEQFDEGVSSEILPTRMALFLEEMIRRAVHKLKREGSIDQDEAIIDVDAVIDDYVSHNGIFVFVKLASLDTASQ